METTTKVKKMSKTEFNNRVAEIIRRNTPQRVENPKMVGKNAMTYARTCEINFERNLEYFTGKKREWTFFSDISIGEWFGFHATSGTIKRCFKEWIRDKEATAELLISIYFKSLEMAARELNNWSQFYTGIYEGLKDLVLDYYDSNDKDAARYVIAYLD